MDFATAPLPESEPQSYRILRDGALDLEFRGWLLGEGQQGRGEIRENPCDWSRGTEVTVYLTTGRRIVAAVRQWTRWENERTTYRATCHATPAKALAWLIEDAGGQLGCASKAAWVEACRTWEGLAAEETVRID